MSRTGIEPAAMADARRELDYPRVVAQCLAIGRVVLAPGRPGRERAWYLRVPTVCGGRSWWAHHRFSRVDIELTILPEKVEELMALLESAVFSGVYPTSDILGSDPAVSRGC